MFHQKKARLALSFLILGTSFAGTPAFSHEAVHTVSGAVTPCVRRFTLTPYEGSSIFVGNDDVHAGYCVQKIQVLTEDTPHSGPSLIFQANIGKEVTVQYTPEPSDVQCDDIASLTHPIECSIRGINDVISISIEDETVYRIGK